jgi:hypothetical protein
MQWILASDLSIAEASGGILALLSIIVIGLKGISHLSRIEATSDHSHGMITDLREDLASFKVNHKEDSDRLWSRLSQHDIDIATLKAGARGDGNNDRAK